MLLGNGLVVADGVRWFSGAGRRPGAGADPGGLRGSWAYDLGLGFRWTGSGLRLFSFFYFSFNQN